MIIFFTSLLVVSLTLDPVTTSSNQSDGKYFLLRQLPTCAESSHSYDVRHYRLDIDLPMNSGAMTACARILIISRVTLLDTFSLHFANLVCDSAKQENEPLIFTSAAGYLRLTLASPLPQGESTAITIFYHRLASQPNLGFYFYSRGGNTRHNICYTVTEPSDSRYWFPCFDEPWDKAEQGCQINITVPDSFTVAANGRLDKFCRFLIFLRNALS